jgi:phospholipid/cholesterol/gamma-HCH transport system substrate-binding protein
MRSRTIREGSIGLLIIFGALVFGGLALWIKGFAFGKESYQITANFPDVNGIQEGDGVRYRGLQVGRVDAIQPSVNGVDVVVEIDSDDLLIPKNSVFKARSSGLIGDTFIDIIPKSDLSARAAELSPIGSNCDPEEIICNDARLPGQKGITIDDLLPYTYRFSRAYGEPQFVAKVDSAVGNAAIAANDIAKLTKETSALVNSLQREVAGISKVTETVSNVANNVSGEITTTAQSYQETAKQISRLTNNVEKLIDQNETDLTATLNSIGTTSDRLQDLVTKLNNTVDATDTERLAANLKQLTANATAASENLKNISESFGSEAGVVSLQQTLDSARVTFDNAQKITSDLESITGDPTFIKNVRDLVNGLSSLVSTTEQLEQQIETDRVIKPMQQALSTSSKAAKQTTE